MDGVGGRRDRRRDDQPGDHPPARHHAVADHVAGGVRRGDDRRGARAVRDRGGSVLRPQRLLRDDVEHRDGQPASADRPAGTARPGEQRVPHDRLGPDPGRRGGRRSGREGVRPPRSVHAGRHRDRRHRCRDGARPDAGSPVTACRFTDCRLRTAGYGLLVTVCRRGGGDRTGGRPVRPRRAR